jgi:hypothetical protein
MATEERDALEAEAAQAAVVAHLDVGDTKYKQSMAEWFQDVHNLPSNKQPRRPPRVDTRNKHVLCQRQAAYTEVMRYYTVLYQRWEQINDKRKRAERSLNDAKRDWKSEMQNRMKSKKISAEERRYRMAADQGNANAQFNLGRMYDEGRGVDQSHEEAVRYCRMVADQGHVQAQFYLGCMYEKGDGNDQSNEEAVRWFIMVANHGNADAQFNLGTHVC